MAVAETARLIASLELKDKLSQGVGAASASVGRLESRVGGLQSKLGGFARNLRGGVSGALGNFTGKLKGAATAGLGLLGIGGLLGLGAAFKSTMEKAREFGDASIQLSRVTGLNIETSSRLVDALDFYGVTAEKATRLAGMLTKNQGNLTKTTKAAAKFEKDYGLRIRDNTGATLDFNKQLLVSADFFNNKSIPASQKAAALAKLYGKSWQDLIPVLALGRKGIEKAEKDAISLSEADLKAITANKEATRKWNDAIGDLQVKIGIGLMPTITELVTSLTGWVDSHGPQIQQFIRDSVVAARGIAGTAVGVISSIKSTWDAIPDGVKDLLIKGIVADRTVKFLFGFSVTGLAQDLVGGVAKGLGGALVQAGIGRAFVQPVFVTNMGAGGVGGAGAGGAAAGGSSALALTIAGILPAVTGIVTGILADKFNADPTRQKFGIGEMQPVVAPISIAGFSNLLTTWDLIQKGIEELNNPRKETDTTTAVEKLRAVALRPPAAPLSPDERQRLSDIRAAEQRVYTGVESMKGAVVQANRSGTSAVVAAIRSINLTSRVTINVPGQRPRTYQTGNTLSRSGSGSGPGGPIDESRL